jgi:hypothetical protein
MLKTAGTEFPTGAKYFYLLHNVQTDSEAHPASYQMVTVALSPVVWLLVIEDDYSTLSIDEVKNCGAIPPHFDISSRYGTSLTNHEDDFNFTFYLK